MQEVSVTIKEVNGQNIAPYGSLIDTAGRKADASSDVFDYWDGLGQVDAEGRVSLGVVGSHPGPLVATNLERHLKTTETLIPMDGDIVLVVSGPTPGAEADLNSVAAFHVPQGKAVTLNAGTWHFVPLNSDRDVKTMVVFRAGTPNDDLFVDDFSNGRDVVVRVIE